MKRIITLSYCIVTVIALLFSSCRSKMPGDDLKIFNYNQASGISSLDPAFASLQSNIWAVNQVYNGLVQVNSKLEVRPCIAKGWTVSSDGTQYIFTLRNDVYFHDDPCFPNSKGRKLTAHDVAYSFHRLVNPATAAKGAWIFNDKISNLWVSGNMGNDTGDPFYVKNDSTFVLELIHPFPPMLSLLTMQYCCIVPREAVEKYGKEFRNHPVGTGPFRFSFWKENEAMVLLRNPNYFERDSSGNQLPYLDGIRISFLDSKTTEFLKFKLKELDMIIDLDAGVRDEVLTKSGELQERYRNKFILEKNNYLNTEYIGINLQRAKDTGSPLADERIRKAINLAINKAELVTYLRNGIGFGANKGIVAPGIDRYDKSDMHDRYILKSLNPYRPYESKQLLGESHYDGAEIVLQCNSANEAVAVFIAEQLKQVGLNMRVETMQGKALNDQMIKGNSLFFRASWIADYPDAESFLTLFYGKYSAPPNYTRFHNEDFDNLYELASLTVSDSVRNMIYHRMNDIIMKELPLIPLYYDETLDFVQPNIKGFEANPLNLLILKEVKKN